MNTLAEHLLPGALDDLDAVVAETPQLTLVHHQQTVNIAAAVFTVAGGRQLVLINGPFRRAQFTALADEVTQFNENTRTGWYRLAAAAADNLRDEAAALHVEAEMKELAANALATVFTHPA